MNDNEIMVNICLIVYVYDKLYYFDYLSLFYLYLDYLSYFYSYYFNLYLFFLMNFLMIFLMMIYHSILLNHSYYHH